MFIDTSSHLRTQLRRSEIFVGRCVENIYSSIMGAAYISLLRSWSNCLVFRSINIALLTELRAKRLSSDSKCALGARFFPASRLLGLTLTVTCLTLAIFNPHRAVE